jgi:hypothetical protein
LSKVADGERTTGYADEDFIAETICNNKEATQEKKK